ncbi:hypothetical protein CAI21_12780 [Alkalilimnicola ehrlichii]|uniref:Xaa-Pro dipeptidyl-peptidase C-terminal domain-containing protein n=2 Tax=Alkalilimnicola ehrlichii TaxID=351052 RepID=A0A3E0X379_9GAMM|nr:hypothetical protein CAI21_12780 [Alkalilimnicola ehrlichii]RFA38684.1 hypothetical protein CAL65_03870 [Alkalilimnicola ehrlichii]
MQTRDGVRLDADVYYPVGAGPFPVLLMRQPYGRRIASTVTYAHPSWYARQGYIVVIQDVRGRGSSEGEFEPFVYEGDDGYDTLEWVSRLPGSSGRVGMYGFSYQGVAQLFAAASRHPALAAICPGMAGFDLYRDWAYEGGAFRLYNSLSWAAQLGAETARRNGDHGLFAERYRVGHTPSSAELIDPAGSVRELLADTFYADWLSASADSDYWRARSPGAQLDDIDLPALHVGGWFDSFLTGTLAGYRHFAKGQSPQRLLIGPWTHLPWTPAVGSVWLGEAAQSPVDALQLRWFDYFLKDIDNGVLDEPMVALYDLGARAWRDLTEYPMPAPSRWHLVSNGRANLDLTAGRLCEAAQAGGVDVIVNDPWRPVPVRGGHLAPAAGIEDRTDVDARPDVLTYTSAPLESTLQLAGPVAAVLACESDQDSFDLFAVLSIVGRDGRARNLTQGYLRTEGAGQHRVELRTTCARLYPGQSLRLSVSGSCYPAFALNDGSGREPLAVRAADYRISTLRLDSNASWLELPLIEAGD